MKLKNNSSLFIPAIFLSVLAASCAPLHKNIRPAPKFMQIILSNSSDTYTIIFSPQSYSGMVYSKLNVFIGGFKIHNSYIKFQTSGGDMKRIVIPKLKQKVDAFLFTKNYFYKNDRLLITKNSPDSGELLVNGEHYKIWIKK